jgi:transglutaminase-like putative cysteine protease
MHRTTTGSVSPVDRFFEFSLLGLLASGYLAVVSSGYLDTPTIVLTAAALILRALLASGLLRWAFPDWLAAAATIAYFGFYPLDYLFVSRSFIPATVHLVFFVATVKLLTARTNRDYFFLAIIALLELLAACVLSYNFSFFFFLALFLVLSVSTLTSAEIRRSAQTPKPLTRAASGRIGFRLTAVVIFVSFGILSLTWGLFFLLPRTARAAFQHLISHRYHLAGFSPHVSLDQTGELRQENTPVMHVRVDEGSYLPMNVKWRGASLGEFDGKRWSNPRTVGDPLKPESSGAVTLDARPAVRGSGHHISYEVRLNDLGADALFFAGIPEYLRIDSNFTVLHYPFGYRVRPGDADAVSYQVYSYFSENVSNSEPLTTELREICLRLPKLDPRIRALAQQAAAGETTSEGQARAVETWLRRNYSYTLELPQTEVPDPLAQFLFERRRGHCEYFASAMAVMLRTLGVPARVATGFQSGVFNPVSGWRVIRSSDAHSWVEAWTPSAGWTAYDPTPPDARHPEVSIWTRIGFLSDAAEVFWQDWVVNYNLDRQILLASRMGESSRRLRFNWMDDTAVWLARSEAAAVAWGKRLGPLLVSLAALGLLGARFGRTGWRWLRTRRRVRMVQRGEGRASDATLLYARMLAILKRRGIEKPAWMTPVEFARVMPEPTLAALVDDVTLAYNECRFGSCPEAAGRMVETLRHL